MSFYLQNLKYVVCFLFEIKCFQILNNYIPIYFIGFQTTKKGKCVQ